MEAEAKPDSLFEQLEPLRRWPIHQWSPAQTDDIGLYIDRSGKWYYRGSEIARRRMVKLFASLLRMEDAEYFLITPKIRYRVRVEECPFLAVDIQTEGQGDGLCIHFRTNMDDVVRVDREHPLTVELNPEAGTVLPTVLVRNGLRAKLTRAVYYSLAELASPGPGKWDDDASSFHVRSNGELFRIG
ncbi:MAG: DUF1285 domain-containing protein [Gammaproteobacteria bacterium]|nr:DUF1285 domain-containing protein [Gammaproteobacteria bacterium]MYD76869.1 DUF1285 domain-containing protein [Gammaproteobacteria bacterium]MYJ51304.1 DUF1285 domain-containing protein [Gammaproteobacteria bacterium]